MKKIVILGAGISGLGSAILAQRQGFQPFVSDYGTISDSIKNRLSERNIQYEEGQHSEDKILSAVEVIKSPGVPEKSPIVVKIRESKIPIVSEIEFAARYMGSAKCICVTGSNGKTTTASLIYKIINDAGFDVALCGNIGDSFAFEVATKSHDWYVLELSSFQLDDMYQFRADIALLLNITPDHLDRYNYKFQNYIESKMRIVQNQTPNDYFIYSNDDATILTEISKESMPMQQLAFTSSESVPPSVNGATLHGGQFVAKVGTRSVEVECRKMQVSGLHNIYNAMAASLAALSAGVSPEQIEQSIYSFSAIKHRMEPIKEVCGVLWINDSKATNTDSAKFALQSIERPMVWIAGGTDKGNDYDSIKGVVEGRVHTLVCMGLDNQKLIDSFSGVIPNIVSTDSLDAAMSCAQKASKSGDVVLLSPACASFDLFKNYEHRGDLFRGWVEKICK